MTATEMGRRSDSLYYDNVSRRELCDRIAHLESDLEDAKAKNADVWGSLKAREMKLAFQIDDNAKLRELLAGDETQRRIASIGEGTVPAYHGTETVDEALLVVENAKLRELVRDMWLHSYCSIAKTREEDEHHIESVIDRMRELGVEVEA